MNKEFIENTIQIWQPQCLDGDITPDDAITIIATASAFFDILNEWEEAVKE